jgi:DNA-binding transcriptional regulator GbsR (MarR family)
MTDEQHQFVEDMGQNMVSWGLNRTTGRVYGYLLIRMEPASLDQITADLEMAKSGVSLAARQLVALGMVRGTGERGSRRLLYEALYDTAAILAARNSQTRDFLDRIRQGAEVAPAGRPRQRLLEMASELHDLYSELPALVRRILERRRA